MTGWLGDDLLLGLFDWAAKTTLILAAAGLVTRTPRASAARRHLIWVAAFAAVLVLPALSLLAPARHLVVLPFGTYHTAVGTIVRLDAPGERGGGPAAGGPVPRADNALLSLTALGVWLAGAAVLSLRAALGMVNVNVLRRHSVEGIGRAVDAAGLAGRIGLARRWELRSSATSRRSGAMTWGVVRPIVLLPARAAEWPAGRLEAVLLHELAHVRRRDSASQQLALAACALLWFNPVVWLCARAMRREAELAADDAVLGSGFRASEYAAHLLQIASESRRERGPLISSAVMATGPSRIEARIESIVDPWRLRGGVRPWEAAAAAATGLVLVATLASTRPSLAQGGEIGQPAPTAVGRNGADAAADVVVGPNPGPGVGPSPRVSAKSSVLVPIGQSERVRPKAARIASGARASAIIDRVSPDLAPGDLPGRADNQRDGPDVQGADTYVAKPRARDNTPTRITGADVWTDPASMP